MVQAPRARRRRSIRFGRNRTRSSPAGVTLDDAKAYCRWAGKRLPTDEEWDRAARGNTSNEFPWGDRFRPDLVVTGSNDTEPVTARSGGASPTGVVNMIGNASELTRNGLARGGSYRTPSLEGALRIMRYETGRSGRNDIGFRCVR